MNPSACLKGFLWSKSPGIEVLLQMLAALHYNLLTLMGTLNE